MHGLGSAKGRASPACAGRIVEGEVRVMKRRRKQVMFGAAKVLPKAFERRAGDSFRMKRKKPIPNFHSVFERSEHLPVNSGSNHKSIDDRLDPWMLLLAQFEVAPEIFQ